MILGDGAFSDFIQPLNLPFCLRGKARSATWKVFNSFMSGVAMYGRIDLILVSKTGTYEKLCRYTSKILWFWFQSTTIK